MHTKVSITRLSEKLKPFSELQLGDYFTTDEKLYIKVDSSTANPNAVNVYTGKTVGFNPHSNVQYHPEVEIRVK